jgi:hypothetical protein
VASVAWSLLSYDQADALLTQRVRFSAAAMFPHPVARFISRHIATPWRSRQAFFFECHPPWHSGKIRLQN